MPEPETLVNVPPQYTTVQAMFADVDRQVRRDLELEEWYWTGRREGFVRGLGLGFVLLAVAAGACLTWVLL